MKNLLECFFLCVAYEGFCEFIEGYTFPKDEFYKHIKDMDIDSRKLIVWIMRNPGFGMKRKMINETQN